MRSNQAPPVLENVTEGNWESRHESTCSGAWLEVFSGDVEILRSETVATCKREMNRYYQNQCTDICPYEYEPECWEEEEDAAEIRANINLISKAPAIALLASELIADIMEDKRGTLLTPHYERLLARASALGLVCEGGGR